jgi:hypothetical protein
MTSHSLAPARLQAAAAARIEGQRYYSSIHEAARSGNAGLVQDHIVADPAAVHAETYSYVVCLCSFFKIHFVNPISTVASDFPLHL